MPTKLLLDPWSPDYEAPIQTGGPEGAATGEIDPSVETADWKAVRPAATVPPRRICFVDGVRSVEARVLAQEDDGKLIHGLFSSAGAGCVVSEGGTAAYDRIKISRYLILGAGRQKTESIAAGTQIVEFKGVASPGDTQDDLMNNLQNLMRTDEVALAEGFLGAGTYVFADGPLNFFSAATDPLVGVIKRIYLPYLDAPHFALVSQLQRGERTPLFSIRDGKYDRYSWFQRLAMPRAMEHGLAGIVRLEVRAALGFEQASEIANFAALRLPEFASTAVRDPRAPQNLVPVGALEEQLRHRLGDVTFRNVLVDEVIFDAIDDRNAVATMGWERRGRNTDEFPVEAGGRCGACWPFDSRQNRRPCTPSHRLEEQANYRCRYPQPARPGEALCDRSNAEAHVRG